VGGKEQRIIQPAIVFTCYRSIHYVSTGYLRPTPHRTSRASRNDPTQSSTCRSRTRMSLSTEGFTITPHSQDERRSPREGQCTYYARLNEITVGWGVSLLSESCRVTPGRHFRGRAEGKRSKQTLSRVPRGFVRTQGPEHIPPNDRWL
jgi:hypothetical protein